MLLEKAIQEHKSAARLLDAFDSPATERGHMDDILVRPYVVRKHWRTRPKWMRKRKNNGK